MINIEIIESVRRELHIGEGASAIAELLEDYPVS